MSRRIASSEEIAYLDDGEMIRCFNLVVSLLLVSCAPRCSDDGGQSRDIDSEASAQALAADSSRDAVQKQREVSRVNPPAPSPSYATRTKCMRPCAVQFDAQAAASLSWPEARDSEYVWDFDDGGPRTDSEGFLAAVVYEAAGTYHPTVTVDGETWNPQTIIVTDPAEIRCVSLVSNWTGCPAGAGHYSSVSSALSGIPTNAHMLFHRGENYGNVNLGGYSNRAFGAYGSGAKPIVSWTGTTNLGTTQTLMDLDYRSSGDSAIGVSGVDDLLLRMDSSGGALQNIWADGDPIFIIDSNISGGTNGMMAADLPYVVIKGSSFTRSGSGSHSCRIQGNTHGLFQNNTFYAPATHTGLTIRWNTSWDLVQGNTFFGASSAQSDAGDEGGLHQYIIWERNIWNFTGVKSGAQNTFSMRNSVIRNNVVRDTQNGGSGYAIEVSTQWGESSSNVQIVNNTIIQSVANKAGITVKGTNLEVRNNIVYSSADLFDCNSGGTQSNNWCYESSGTNDCEDPVDGSNDCYNPNFVSTNPASADFVRPGAGTRGIDAGIQTVAVWNDYDNAPRSMIDVGAVER